MDCKVMYTDGTVIEDVQDEHCWNQQDKMVWAGTLDIQSSSVPGNAQLVEQNEGLGIVLDTVTAVAGEEWSAVNC